MKYIKTYENIITDIFKKKKLNVIEPETEYSFLNYVTINDITFNVGDYVKRKIDKKIGVIENITKKFKKNPRLNEFRINFGGPWDYVSVYTFYDIYTDEETELLTMVKGDSFHTPDK